MPPASVSHVRGSASPPLVDLRVNPRLLTRKSCEVDGQAPVRYSVFIWTMGNTRVLVTRAAR